MLTIGELRAVIKDLPDEMQVGQTGHFGVFMEAYGAQVRAGLLINDEPGTTGLDRPYRATDKVTAITFLAISMPEIEQYKDF